MRIKSSRPKRTPPIAMPRVKPQPGSKPVSARGQSASVRARRGAERKLQAQAPYGRHEDGSAKRKRQWPIRTRWDA